MPAPNQAVVSARMVLQSQYELQRRGVHRVLTELENAEPDLTEWVLETSTTLYHQLLHTGASAKETRRLHEGVMTLALVCIGALRKVPSQTPKRRRGK